MSPKPLFRTPPATKGTARAVAAPAVPALGVCTRHMNRHQLCRLASYCRSKRLILHSLIASAATTANAAHPTNPSAAITDIATCTAVTPDMWVQFTLTIVGALIPTGPNTTALAHGVLVVSVAPSTSAARPQASKPTSMTRASSSTANRTPPAGSASSCVMETKSACSLRTFSAGLLTSSQVPVIGMP